MRVENLGKASVMASFSVYLDKNTELLNFHVDKATKSNTKVEEYVLKPTVFTGKFLR